MPVIEVDGLVKRYVGRAVVDGVTFSARGFNNREAAAHLFISEATVKTHLLHIYAKLGVNDRAAAVATAYERGLLTTGEGNR